MNNKYKWYYDKVLKDNSSEDAEFLTNEFTKNIKDVTYIEDAKLSEEYIYKRIRMHPFGMLDFENEIEEEISECLALFEDETEYDKKIYDETKDELENYFCDWIEYWLHSLIEQGKVFEIKRRINKDIDQYLYVDTELLKYNNLLR